MSTRNLPGTEAARHGTGDADLTIMLGAHEAFRRDLARLARAAAFADLPDPARRAAVQAGWEVFKRQLHLHHTAEDTIIWPALRDRLGHSAHALSVLDAMEDEHKAIDPLLVAVDEAFGEPDARALAGVTDALATSLDRRRRRSAGGGRGGRHAAAAGAANLSRGLAAALPAYPALVRGPGPGPEVSLRSRR